MKRKLFTATFTVALAAVAGLAILTLMPNSAAAFDQWGGGGSDCSANTCHGNNFGFGDPLHNLHIPMTPDCNACHPSGGGSTPVQIGSSDNGAKPSCSGCHVGTGLRTFHRNNNVGTTCDGAGCHTSPESPPPESTLPPYYGTVTAPSLTDPCNPTQSQNVNENWDGNFIGLDNDGDGLVDTLDPDCQAPPANPAVLDIKANGMDANVPVARGARTQIDVSLVCNDEAGNLSDYIAVVITRFGVFHFDLASGWTPGLDVTLTAPCTNVNTRIMNMPLPVGTYKFFWALDSTPDGMITPASANIDSVKVIVQ